MRHIIGSARHTSLTPVLVWGLVLLSSSASLAQEAAQSSSQQETVEAKVLFPEDGARLSSENLVACPDKHKHCLFVDGQVPNGYHPFLAVAPLRVAPKIWIQPQIVGVKKSGRFTGMVYLGTKSEGIGEKFNIFVFAHKTNKNYFTVGKLKPETKGLPEEEGVLVSEPVTVLREE
jgi:hypothetical protein